MNTKTNTKPKKSKTKIITLAQVANIAIANSVWRPAPVSAEPSIKLYRWKVVEVTGVTEDGEKEPPTIHFVGSPFAHGGEGRVCSAVQSYDNNTRSGITKSGREYELVGLPGYDADAEYVFGVWISRFPKGTVWNDVTGRYYEVKIKG